MYTRQAEASTLASGMVARIGQHVGVRKRRALTDGRACVGAQQGRQRAVQGRTGEVGKGACLHRQASKQAIGAYECM